MGGNDEVKVSAWVLKLDFGINMLPPRAFAIDSPKPGLALRCVIYFASTRGSTQYGSYNCKGSLYFL